MTAVMISRQTAISWLALAVIVPAFPASPVSFDREVQPILSDFCYACHGPDAAGRKARLRLDLPESAYALREEGSPIVPHHPERSVALLRIESPDEDEVMPPADTHRRPSAAQREILRRWIAEGGRYERHWAFAPPGTVLVPDTRFDAAARNPIDRFIFSRLEREGLAPAPPADRRSLLRRVAFDLAGLPPEPAELAAFAHDEAPDAYEKAVDRYLASPRYGERRASAWLDLARSGDTHGLHNDNVRTAWPYRDYVVRAFNANRRYDDFLVEQLAGDLLPPVNLDQLIATGFNRAHVTSSEGGALPEELQANIVNDRVATVGAAFLGLTTGCAACHDHKFDPLTQREFYELAAFFNNSEDGPIDRNIAAPPPSVGLPTRERRGEFEAEFARLADVERRLQVRREAAPGWIRRQVAEGTALDFPRPTRDALVTHLRADEGGGTVLRDTAQGALQSTVAVGGSPPVWGETVLHWPALRLAVGSTVELPVAGDFETTDAFSAVGWIRPRQLPSWGKSGAILARFDQLSGRGWDLFWAQGGNEDSQSGSALSALVVHLMHDAEHGIELRTPPMLNRLDGWYHCAVTYDGSGRAAGVRLFVNGRPAVAEVVRDSLGGRSIRTPVAFQLGRRAGGSLQAECGYQDIRLYRRALPPAEVAQIHAGADLAAEILTARPTARWTADEAQLVQEHAWRHRDPEARMLFGEREAILARLEGLAAGGPRALITRERSGLPTAHVLDRGVFSARKERVAPAVPGFLPPLPHDAPRNRLGLARWLVAPGHPLTARVAANRMWQEIFGTGLVETADDFGTVGARPTHPALLDWLAHDFVASGWDVKRFFRQLVLSATYRQSARVSPALAERDPANRLLARGPRLRLDAECVRDAALAAAGLLTEDQEGPPVKIYQPPGLWEAVAFPGSNTQTHRVDSGAALFRRSLYVFWKRTAPPPLLQTFDAPSRDTCTVRRERTNTPLQSLALLNAPDFIEAARHLAARAWRASPDDGARLQFMAVAVLSRSIRDPEKRTLHDALLAFRSRFVADTAAARAQIAVGQSPVPTDVPAAELAAWTLIARLFLNLDEALVK